MKKKPTVAVLAALTAMMIIAPGVAVGAASTSTNYELVNAPYTDLDTKYSDTSKTEMTNISPKKTTAFVKVLEIDDDTNIPKAGFTFTVSAPTTDIEANATTGTLAVKHGINTEAIKWKDYTVTNKAFVEPSEDAEYTTESHTVNYTASDVTIDNSTFSNSSIASGGDTNVVLLEGNDGTYYAEKKIQLDFSACAYPEPGIYRYYIQESGASGNLGVTNDPDNTGDNVNTWRTIDVYVNDGSYYTETTVEGVSKLDINRKCYIKGYVMYIGKITTAPYAEVSSSRSN
ncbi:MAG: hypothetical protein K6G68_12430, partial [Oscillospiraceae bacterium]|nr:hypothetical protein [Oscillospiraceae bacterium]